MCILAPGHSLAQDSEEALVKLDLTQAHSVYAAGASYPMALSINIKQGYHINSTQPESPELVPTRLTLLNAPTGISLAKYDVPPVQYHQMPDEEEPWAVWSGNIKFEPVVEIAKSVKPGKYELAYQLFYQACDDHICQMPTTVELGFILEVTEN